MASIGLFYGSDEGHTETVAEKIQQLFAEGQVDIHDIADAEPEDFSNYEYLILGTPTLDEGCLQSDWDAFVENIYDINFSDKNIALFGLGDQLGYGDWYLDAMGILHDMIRDVGPRIVGYWPLEGYDFIESKAIAADGENFVGLALDEDTQSEMTDARLEQWVKQVKQEFGFAA